MPRPLEGSLRFVFFGTPEFAVDVLDALEAAGQVPVAVVCQPDRPRGRGRRPVAPPVKDWAAQRGIEVLQPPRQKDPDYRRRFEALQPDLALVAAFGQILPRAVLAVPRLGFINVHPSLVPRYRGAAPLQWTLINGDRETGVSILEVTPRIDDGDVLAQQRVAVEPDENAAELGARLAALGGQLAAEVMARLERGPIARRPQGESGLVMARQLDKADGRLDWNQPARALHDRVRGVQPWPGATTRLGDQPLKIARTRPEPDRGQPEAAPGQIIEAAGDRLLVQTGQGALALLEIQPAGKKRMPARAFLAGRRIEPGARLG